MGFYKFNINFIFFFICLIHNICFAQELNGAIRYQMLENSCKKESLPGRSGQASVYCNNDEIGQLIPELSVCEVRLEQNVAEYICIGNSWKVSSGTELYSRDKRFTWGAFFTGLKGFLPFIEVVFCTLVTGNKECQSSGAAPAPVLKPPKYDKCPETMEYTARKKQKEVTVRWEEPEANDDDGIIVSNEQTCCSYKRGEKFPGLPDDGLEHRITYTAKDNLGLTDTCSFFVIVKYITCEEPKTPLNGRKVFCPDGYIYGGECTFECDTGYALAGAATATCQEDQTWDQLPTCSKITCPAPFEIQNGKVVCDSPLHAYQEDCVFECDDGFKQNGPRKMTCQADGMWSLKDTQISCRDDSPPQIDCKSPQVFYADRSKFETIVTWIEPTATDNIDQVPTIVKLSGPENGDQLTEGIHTVIYKSIDSAGNSFPALSECTINIEVKVIKCSSGPSDALDTSRFLMVNCSDTTFYNGVTCTLDCDLNLPLNGTDLMTCEREGTSEKGVWNWGSGNQPFCQVVECPTLDWPKNGAVTNNTVQARLLHVMLCQTGYDIPSVGARFVGTLTCQDNGEWFPLSAFPDCIVPTFPWLNLPAELYYEGTCNNEETQNKIKEQILVYLQGVQADIDNSICRQEDTCKVENVVVVCGDSSGRKRREEHHIGKRQNGYAIAYFDIKTIYDEGNKTTQEAYPEIKGLLTAIALKIQEDINNGALDIEGFTLSHDAFTTATAETFYCDPGYKIERGSVVCKPCPAGTYLNSTTSNCEFCDIGEYMAEEGAVKCHLCSDGYSTITTGAKSQNECFKLCRAGFFSTTTMEPCSACPVSTYQSSRGQAKCISCEYGLSTSGRNSTSVDQCQMFDFVIAPLAQRTNVGSYSASNATIITISMWLKPHNNENTGEFSLYISDNIDDIMVLTISRVISVKAGNSATQTSDQPLSAETWSHIIGTVDIASRTLQLYINGQLTVDSTNLSIDDSKTLSTGTVSIQSDGTDVSVSGLVMYDRALSSSERVSLSQSCTVQHGDEMFSMVDILQSATNGIVVVLPSACDPIDECKTGPCGKHQCINHVRSFQCVCHDGMTGERCDIPPDYCEDNECDQGECVPGNSSYSCNCSNGYTGPICDIPPVDGGWSDWMEWSGCDKTCGGGSRTRTRSCDNPPKGYMGADCAGNEEEVETCNAEKCPQCPNLRRQFGTTLSCTNNDANGLKECNMTCISGKALPNGQKSFEKYSCGDATNYSWVPIDKTPTCVDLSPPDIFGTQTTLTYTNVIPDQDKPAVSAAIKEKFSDMDCVKSGKCSLSSTVSDSSADRKRRSTASAVTLQFSIQLTENGDLAIADYIASGTETAAMTELLSTLNSISAFISFIQNSTASIFEVTVNGVQYRLENSTASHALTVLCATGHAGADGLCGKCAAGTKQVETYCIDCDVGTYQDLTGQTVCNPCPTGYTTSTYGAANVSECNVATGSGSTGESPGNSKKLTIILAVCLTAASVIVVVGVVVFVWKKCKRRTFRDSRATGSFASLSMVRPNSSFILESENAKEKFSFNVNSSHNGPDNDFERKHTTLSVSESD